MKQQTKRPLASFDRSCIDDYKQTVTAIRSLDKSLITS